MTKNKLKLLFCWRMNEDFMNFDLNFLSRMQSHCRREVRSATLFGPQPILTIRFRVRPFITSAKWGVYILHIEFNWNRGFIFCKLCILFYIMQIMLDISSEPWIKSVMRYISCHMICQIIWYIFHISQFLPYSAYLTLLFILFDILDILFDI